MEEQLWCCAEEYVESWAGFRLRKMPAIQLRLTG